MTTNLTKAEAVAKSLAALMQDDVTTAVELSSHYFGGAGSLYERETISMVRYILEHDWSPDPRIKPSVLAPLRVAAAAMELWGQGEMKDYVDVAGPWKYELPPETITRLLYSAGLEQYRLQHLERRGVRRVEVRSAAADPAPGCCADIGRIFPLRDAPFLPHPEATCRCSYLAARAPAKAI